MLDWSYVNFNWCFLYINFSNFRLQENGSYWLDNMGCIIFRQSNTFVYIFRAWKYRLWLLFILWWIIIWLLDFISNKIIEQPECFKSSWCMYKWKWWCIIELFNGKIDSNINRFILSYKYIWWLYKFIIT